MLPSVKKVFKAIDSSPRDGNKIRLTYRQISEKAKIPVSAVSGALRILKRDGLIDWNHEHDSAGRVKANVYRIMRKLEK